METVQFKTKIKNGVIEIPKKYQDTFKDNVNVTLVSESSKAEAKHYLDELMAHPRKVMGFEPMSREETHARD